MTDAEVSLTPDEARAVDITRALTDDIFTEYLMKAHPSTFKTIMTTPGLLLALHQAWSVGMAYGRELERKCPTITNGK